MEVCEAIAARDDVTVEVGHIASSWPRASRSLWRRIAAPEQRGGRPEDKGATAALDFHSLAGLLFSVVAFVAGDAETGFVVLGMVAAGVVLSLHAEVRLNVLTQTRFLS